jgi:hypothetical protein
VGWEGDAGVHTGAWKLEAGADRGAVSADPLLRAVTGKMPVAAAGKAAERVAASSKLVVATQAAKAAAVEAGFIPGRRCRLPGQ